MTQRSTLVLALVLLCAAPCSAQDSKQQQIEELRARLTKSDDMMLDLARKHDAMKKRLQDEKQTLLQEIVELRKENALLQAKLAIAGKNGAAKQDPALDAKKLTLNFNETPLEDVAAFLRDITGMNLTLSSSVPADAIVSLRVRDMTVRNALDQLCENARTADGEELALMWRLKSGAVQIAKKKKKKKN